MGKRGLNLVMLAHCPLQRSSNVIRSICCPPRSPGPWQVGFESQTLCLFSRNHLNIHGRNYIVVYLIYNTVLFDLKIHSKNLNTEPNPEPYWVITVLSRTFSLFKRVHKSQNCTVEYRKISTEIAYIKNKLKLSSPLHYVVWRVAYLVSWSHAEHLMWMKLEKHYWRPSSFFLGWEETESTWHVSHHLAYCTSLGWWMMEWLVEETEALGENVLPCCFVYYKSHFTSLWLEPGSLQWESGD
jgi:hypothetical protein